ncbi:hypothetical protein HBI69_023820 [Parastagonospora nodorum]|nr:hypothetical protein HBI69_023820 [Parastagonospora nodorum]
MCAKDDLIRRKSLLLTSMQTPNYVNTFSLDFAFLFNILLLIAFIISYCLFADKLVYALNRAIVVLIIILRSTPSTLLAEFISTTKIRDPLLKTNYEEQVLLTSVKKNYYCTPTDILHLLLKGLVIKMLDFMQDMLDDIYPKQKAIIQQLVAIISSLFVLKAPFTLHFIRAVCDLVILAQYKRIQPYLTKLPLSEIAANIAISNFIYAAAVFQSSSKRHNDPEYCDEEVLYLILTIINYTCYDKDGKHIAYIGAFSEILLFNNNRQINNTTRMLSVPFKFYDLSMIIRLVHLVLRDLPNLITRTTMSYYVNNYID